MKQEQITEKDHDFKTTIYTDAEDMLDVILRFNKKSKSISCNDNKFVYRVEGIMTFDLYSKFGPTCEIKLNTAEKNKQIQNIL